MWIQSTRALRAVRVSVPSLQVSVAMLYYGIVMVSIGSLSTGSPSVSSFSSGECGNAYTTTIIVMVSIGPAQALA